MFRKIFSVFLISLITLSLAGCGNKFRIEPEGMPDALRTQLEEQIKNGEAMLAVAQDDAAKAEALLEIAFGNEQLGRLDLAIPFYEKILVIDPKHNPALNNLGVIYEKVGDYITSAKYYGQLLEANPSNTEALGDALRVLVAAGHFDDAQSNLENFARYNSDSADEAMLKFISDQYEIIQAARLNSQK